MSSKKRKDPPKGVKEAKESHAKRTKTDLGAKTAKAPKNNESTTHSKPAEPKKSSILKLLKEDEPMFPRGGGSILTPLEQKKINLEAKADAAAEDEFDTASKAKSKKKRRLLEKSTQKSGKKESHIPREEPSVRIEGLNFKKLVKGSLVLGQIAEITPLELLVALPNNLTGHVALTSISDKLTSQLQEAQDAEDAKEGEAEEDGSADISVNPSSLFHVGQYVRACVLSTTDEDGPRKGKRRIELSLRPQDTNTDLSSSDVVVSTALMASISSVEDRGCVMDIGLEHLDLKGFVANENLDKSIGPDRRQPGNVFLCLVTGRSPNGRIVQLTTEAKVLGDVKALPYTATTINSFQPGTVAELLVSDITPGGLAGKILGHLDAVADRIHSGIGPESVDLASKYKVGTKVRARIICNFPAGNEPKVGVSLLPHILSLSTKSAGNGEGAKAPVEILPPSSFVDECVVRYVEPATGLFVDLGVQGFRGFVHISRVKDGKEDALYESSGPFKLDSKHKGRVLGYNPIDGLFSISFEQSVLDQQYLRLEDIPLGAVVKCTIEAMVIGPEGVKGLIVKLTDRITGFIPLMHLADVELQHPEKKFREGMTVKARVLSVNLQERQMRLTLKKTLVNSDAPVLKSLGDVSAGVQAPCTIIKILDNGAIVQFYGSLRGFLPKGEMSEAYIRDPKEHFRVGQVVNVFVRDVDQDKSKLIVSCKDPSAFGIEKQTALNELEIGTMVSGKVMEKTEDIILELVDSGLKAILPVGHLADKPSKSKARAELKRINVGQTLNNLMVIDKNVHHRAINLTRKMSLIEAHKQGKLLLNLADANVGDIRVAYVRDIVPAGVAVQFGGGVRGFLPKSHIPKDKLEEPDFGMRRLQSVTVVVVSIMPDKERMIVALPDSQEKDSLFVGAIVNATVKKVRATQLNVQIGDKQQGRVDVSEIFDAWKDIKNRKAPLSKYKRGDTIKVRVLGTHNARNHRYLPISHRSTHEVLELSAKPSTVEAGTLEPLTIDKIKIGSEQMAFVNQSAQDHVWAHLSPYVRSRINALDLADDRDLLENIQSNFPVGSAVRVRVTAVNEESGRVDLCATSLAASTSLSWDDMKPNTILSGLVTKVSERSPIVQLNRLLAFPIHLPDLADDFSEANPLAYKAKDVVKVSIVEVDKHNKRLRLSTRPSRILSSDSPVVDREISSASQLAKGDIVRGFVKNVADVGLFVNLGGNVVGHVKIANLSDKFIKEWKEGFQVDQLVKGRVIMADHAAGRIELSLKESALGKDWVSKMSLSDLKKGQILTGKVRKVEPFGAFIELDNSDRVRGLCHRTQMSDEKVSDATKLYSEGDAVKVYVLTVNPAQKRVNFSLKPSHFDTDSDAEMDVDEMGVEAEVELELGMDEDEDSDGGVSLDGVGGLAAEDDESDEDSDMGEDVKMANGDETSAAKYDWGADAFAESDHGPDKGDDSGPQLLAERKKRRKKAEIQVDRTAELDARGPQSASDYERLLLSQPDSSALWLAYMAHQMEVSELTKAREIAERAINTINIREETEKLNVWIAYLNLEMAYGTKDKFDEVFKRACQYNDEKEVCATLVSNYIKAGKKEDADALFQTMVKKFGSKSPEVWLNYAHFLFVTMEDAARGRALLSRAQQSLEQRHHLHTAARFAALEWRSPKGDPEKGRTLFEGLLSRFPKKGDVWQQLLDLEMSATDSKPEAVRAVYERRAQVKGMKPAQAQKWFEMWADWEAEVDPKGDGKEKAMKVAAGWVAEYKARQVAKQQEDAMDED